MNRILIVDDNLDFLNLLKNYLKDEFEIDVSHNAKDALIKAESTKYSALILDVSLPDFTGFFLASLIRKSENFLPIVFLTNYDGEITRENAEQVGAELWRKIDVVASPETLIENIKKLYE